MSISVITPFYNGNKYMNSLTNSVKQAENQLHKKYPEELIEWIVVNDSPQCKINLPEFATDLNIKIITQKKNSGIHSTRVLGLKNANGDYIHFLDQDDQIEPDFYSAQLSELKRTGADVSICNGYRINSDGSHSRKYNTVGDLQSAKSLQVFLRVCCPITSPGQCLIKKDSIPTDWQKNIMQTNGSDDLMLWIMMLKQNKKFNLLNECLYIHNYTGKNVSGSTQQVFNSSSEAAKILRDTNIISEKEYVDLQHSIEWSARKRKENIKHIFSNPTIAYSRIYWKVRKKYSKKV